MIAVTWGNIEICRITLNSGEMLSVIGSQFQARVGADTFDGIISKPLTDHYTYEEYAQICSVFGVQSIIRHLRDGAVMVTALGATTEEDLRPHGEAILDSYRAFLSRARANNPAADQA